MKIACALSILLLLSNCGNPSDTQKSEFCNLKAFNTNIKTIIDGHDCSNTASPVVKLSLFDDENTEFTCSGVIVSDSFVLTSAHCFYDSSITGAVLISNDIYGIKNLFIHPKASDKVPYDVALIELDKKTTISPIPISSHVIPEIRDSIEILGYGKSSITDNQNKTIGILRSGNMMISSVSFEDFAAIYDGSNENTCIGDSGGPAIKSGYLIGITTSGENLDCSTNDRSSFVSVQSIKDFLQLHIPDLITS